jgi:hypothetical protein
MSRSGDIVQQTTTLGLPLPPPGGAERYARIDWEKLWLATQRRPWRTLALVPAGSSVPDDFTLDIAASLVRAGTMHLGVPIRIADGTRVALAQLMQFMAEVSSVIDSGDMVMIALGPVRENPTTVSLAQAADHALLCVPLDQVSIAETKRTLEEIGRDHFVGGATFRL